MARPRKVIITCAVTGSIPTPTMSPALPVTPEAITVRDGVATIKNRKDVAVDVMRKYLRKADVEDSYEYAFRYLERIPRVDHGSIQTVLAMENRPDIAANRFYDNTIIDRLVQEGFFEGLYK